MKNVSTHNKEGSTTIAILLLLQIWTQVFLASFFIPHHSSHADKKHTKKGGQHTLASDAHAHHSLKDSEAATSAESSKWKMKDTTHHEDHAHPDHTEEQQSENEYTFSKKYSIVLMVKYSSFYKEFEIMKSNIFLLPRHLFMYDKSFV